jgi:hypothetical protein
MGLFQKIAEARELAAASQDPDSGKIDPEQVQKEKKARQNIADKKKPGLMERLGVKKEKKDSEEEQQRQHRHRVINQIWIYLRSEIDLGVQEYNNTGHSSKLQTCLSPELYQQLTAHLSELKQHGFVWSFPDRAVQGHAKIKVIDEQLNIKTKQPTQFTVAERFVDHSHHQPSSGGAPLTADGDHRELTATIDVLTENNSPIYKIIALNKEASDQSS